MGKKMEIYKKKFRKLDLSKEFYESRLIVKELYENSLKLHESIEEEYNSSECVFNINNIIKGIEVNEEGIITGWSEINWSIDVISNLNNIIKKILSIKIKLNNESNFTLQENVLMQISNDILIDFCNNQNIFNLLNANLKLCSQCDISKLDGLIFNLSKMSKEKAKESFNIYKKYNDNVNELKLNLL